MEQNVNPWKANFMNGLILSLLGIVYTLALFFLDLSTNKSLGYIFIPIQIIVMYFLIKSYRDNFMHGMITFGQATGAGVIIFVYYAIISAVFAYIFYSFIDTSFIGKMIAMSEEAGLKKGYSQEQIDLGMKFTKKIMTPFFMSIMSILSNMFFGLIISLIIAAFVRKEGNPLIEPNAQ
jgi:hypothetical protein